MAPLTALHPFTLPLFPFLKKADPKQKDLMQASEAGMRRIFGFCLIIWKEFPEYAACFKKTGEAYTNGSNGAPGPTKVGAVLPEKA